MAEFTDRERKIVYIMHTLINHNLKNVSQQEREEWTKEHFRTCGLFWNEQEVIDIILAINQETKQTTEKLTKRFGFILRNDKKI